MHEEEAREQQEKSWEQYGATVKMPYIKPCCLFLFDFLKAANVPCVIHVATMVGPQLLFFHPRSPLCQVP